MNVKVLNKPARPKKSPPKPAQNSDPANQSVWDFSQGPDRITLRITPAPEHKRETSPAEYRPARDIALLPEKGEGEDEGKGKSSERSTCFYLDPIDWLIKVAEGQLEMNSMLRFLSDPTVKRIEPQYGPVRFTSAQGKLTHTVFDGRVTYSDASKTVVSVKPKAKAAKYKIDELNRLILDQMPPEEADRVQLVTEQDLPQWAIANYRLFHSVRNDFERLFEGEMRKAARSLRTPQSIDAFARPWGGSKTVFRTVVHLIFAGALKQIEPGEINESTVVIGAFGASQETNHVGQ